MSHFSVMVRVPAKIKFEDLEEFIIGMMVPYKESGCGDKDTAELKKYLTFHDTEEESISEYGTGTCRMIRLVDGAVCCAYDNRFRNPDLFSDEGQWKYPPGSSEFEMPLKERYETFEEYMADYCGSHSRDPETGRYGYWQNPNKKWDYWRIGGRFRGKLIVNRRGFYAKKSWEWEDEKNVPDGLETADIARVSWLDFATIEQKTDERMMEFWTQWQQFCDGEKFDSFDGPRSTAFGLGLLDCKSKNELTGDEWKVIPWNHNENRFDVLKNVSLEEFKSMRNYFLSVGTWARLDADGWKEKGKMGWFACSDATTDSTKGFMDSFVPWIKADDQEDWLAILDCHI